MRKFAFLFLLLLVSFFLAIGPNRKVLAQNTPDLPVYVVQPGDNLTSIAIMFNVSVNELIFINNITEPNSLSVGTQLKIPGFSGVEGVISPIKASLGDNYHNLIIKYQLPRELFLRLNKITSPSEIIIGSTIVILEKNATKKFGAIGSIKNSGTLIEAAIENDLQYWSLKHANYRYGTWDFLPSEIIFSTVDDDHKAINTISELIQQISLSSTPLKQGETVIIRIATTESVNFSGTLAGKKLIFYAEADNNYIALQGIPRLSVPGKYTFLLTGISPDQNSLAFEQGILLGNRARIEDPRLIVDPATTDSEIVRAENELVEETVRKALSPDKLWDENFQEPIDVPNGYYLDPHCITDRFGNLRAYNDGAYDFYHTGLDLSACGNTLNVYAVAKGRVILSESLIVRGNYVMIDHGWGVLTAYGHLKETYVSNGEVVDKGQLIGLIGNTGRVTGPHLHWEVWVNGVLVDPLQWLGSNFP